MGAAVSAEDERPESVFAKNSFQSFSIGDVYDACARAKKVMAPVIRDRRARGEIPDPSESDESEAHDSHSNDDSDGENAVLVPPGGPDGPLTSLFGVDISFSDFFNVFGPYSSHTPTLCACTYF